MLAVLGHLKLSLERRLQGKTKGNWVGKSLTQKQIQSRIGGYTSPILVASGKLKKQTNKTKHE